MKHRVVKRFQKLYKVKNAMNTIETSDSFLNSYHCQLNIQYGNTFPNSFLDIYRCRENSPHQPLLFYVHGGGYTWGDKRTGDPNAGSDKFLWYFERFLEKGYHIVSINYAFAPDFQYPTPILQIGEAIHFLKQHGDKYGISTKMVVFAGSSAGGQLIGQFVNIQTNQEYADKIGISPTIKKSEIKAVLFNSALLDMESFGKTGFFITDWLFTKCGQAYFNEKKLEGRKGVLDSSVITNLSDKFPPTFISDANTASFYNQAKVLEQKLKQFDITHTLNYYPKSEKKLLHGFENVDNFYGHDNMDKMIAFLDKLSF